MKAEIPTRSSCVGWGGGGGGGTSTGIGTKTAGGSISSGHALIVNQQYDPEDQGQCPRSVSCLALLDPFPPLGTS